MVLFKLLNHIHFMLKNLDVWRRKRWNWINVGDYHCWKQHVYKPCVLRLVQHFEELSIQAAKPPRLGPLNLWVSLYNAEDTMKKSSSNIIKVKTSAFNDNTSTDPISVTKSDKTTVHYFNVAPCCTSQF